MFNSNGMCRKQYVTSCVLKVVRYKLPSLSWLFQKPSVTLSLENIVAPLSKCDILSRVGALWCSLMIASFKSQGSRQM